MHPESDVGTIVFDLDGVVYIGHETVDGAGKALTDLKADGWHVLFATNNSSRTVDDVATKIHKLTGVTVGSESVLTSGLAAAREVRDDAKVFVVGEAGLVETLRSAGVTIVDEASDADTVVVGIAFDLSYEDIRVAADAIRAGADFIATNTDSTYPTPTGLAPGAGAIVAAIQTAAGRKPRMCGKPHPPMGALVTDLVRGDIVWMVGDRPETDIAFGKAFGWRTVLVGTGVTTDPQSVPTEHRPDVVVDSIRDVPRIVVDSA